MIIVMSEGATAQQIEAIKQRLTKEGLQIHLSQGVEKTIIGVIGDKSRISASTLEAQPGVEKVMPVLQPYKLAGRSFRHENTVIRIGDVEIGGDALQVFAGPCAVESREQLLESAQAVKAAGARILRGGAFKPRTSPYAFQGLEEQGLKLLAQAREETGLLICTEVMDTRSIEMIAEYSDILQVGTRNMQNFHLLRELSRVNRPILLKRGLSATIEEWLMAAEYIMAGGNYNVILCERGIRTFETQTRNTLDLSAIPIIKSLSHLPIIVDPSHGTGKRHLVRPMSMAAVAAGADGIMVEVHPNPAEALCDGPQSLRPEEFASLMDELRRLAGVMGRTA
ncbi:phospho-2-dehydro-3-deoxyheptonate aldolase, putative [Heliomicrobium modesticaldum Ice1]|uniref:Phospho-2-dehydro-3-deoxyheptonate aldolase, putative n=1 Tax=Heliobacterium modesticaldum (strain ATCC 51547 / Ice1) TaxID=498761 RepID=B0TFQ1_HELMI|nr:3-deoxy-7-phosphoheptulonate synthase [Heliomicrobium modesticaldum]ABZ84481.1 phospho-2-dehydro-3-deoxyheptonate aldolase, putative [Heliomicrobium modesticaldum Ice1]